MFASVRRWLRNNRVPIAIGAGVVGAGYVVTQYLLSKLSDARERITSDRIAKDNLRRRFEQNQEDCSFTVLALLPTATTSILSVLDTERITYHIQQIKSSGKSHKPGSRVSSGSTQSIADTTLTEDDGRSLISVQSESGIHASQIATPSSFAAAGPSGQQDGATNTPRKTKRQLWDYLTISAITRSFTLIYTLALLIMLTRVQLNLLGRRSYLSSVVTLATGAQQATISLENKEDDNTEQEYGSDFDTNRKYLVFSWWLLNEGWLKLMHRVESAVRTVFGTLSPRDLVSFDRFGDLTAQVRKLVETSTREEGKTSEWLPFLLPPVEQEDDVIRASRILEDASTASIGPQSQSPPAGLRRLLDETADLIESPAFSHVLTLLLDAGFSTLVDKKLATEAFDLGRAPSTEGPHLKPTDPSRTKVVLLPKILSVLTRQAHVIGNGIPNEYLQAMEAVRPLEAFAAVVYSSNWENEMRDDELAETAVLVGQELEPRLTTAATEVLPVSGEQSAVVDAQADFEGAWGRATGKNA